MDFSVLIGILGFITMLLLIVLGIPIFLSMLAVSFAGFWLLGGATGFMVQLENVFYAMGESYVFAVIPLFMLMGELSSQIGLGESAFAAANKWIGKFRGGLLMATIGANAVFGAVSGTPVTGTIVSVRVALPELLKHRYDRGLCLAAIVSAGTLVALIPPSTPILIFCILTDVPMGRALVAGIIPGILLTLVYCATVWIYGKISPNKVPRVDLQVSWKEKFASLTPLWPIIMLFLLVIGGIYFGVFPPTVGGAIAASATLLYAVIRRASKKKIGNSFREVCVINCQIFPMIIAGFIFARFTAMTHLADYLTEFVTNLNAPPLAVMAVVLIAYILISFPMDLMPAMIITLPIFFPLLTSIGFSPYVLVVVLVCLMTLANYTPPTGTQVYITASLAKVNVAEIWRAIIPWFITTFTFIWIIILCPSLTTWLPDLFY